jgi:acetylornithine deacetylase/succinyl-diaminopimelate desuccinylase-like protein
MYDAVASATGKPASFECMPTPSDANFFAEKGRPVIICGPGNLFGNGVHGLDEHIEINSIVDAAKTYAAFLINYCSTER